LRAYLEIEEARRLEEAAQCVRDRLLVRLLIRLGCRVSEALAIEVKDLDFEGGTVTIRHLKSKIKLSCPQCKAGLGRSHTFCPKCGFQVKEAAITGLERRRMRTLPLDEDTLEMLKGYIQRVGAVNHNDRQLIFGITRHCAGR